MEEMWMADVAVAGLTAIVSAALLLIYWKSWKKTKAQLMLGLVVFALVFLLENLYSVTAYFAWSGMYETPVAFPVFVLHILEFIALSILLWFSSQ